MAVFKRILGMLAIVCLATSMASAQSPFIGSWKLDPLKSRMPDEMKVQRKGGSTYAFDFGGGPETIAINGSDQPGLDSTLLSVKAAGPGTWIVERKKGGRLWIKAVWKLSNHDRTLADTYRQFEPDGSTLSMDYVYQRVGEGTGFAADWQSIKETANSPFVLDVKPFQGDGLSFVSPIGTTNATFENNDHPHGDTSSAQGISKSIRRVDDNTLIITIKRDAKEVATHEVALSTNRKNLTLTMRVVGRDRPNVLVFDRR
jgi:hypothetical protein